MMFTESDVQHIEWLRLKGFQARERLEAAQAAKNDVQADALIDLIEALGNCCTRSIWGIVKARFEFGDSTIVAREVRAMARDIIDLAWEVDEALTVISEYVLQEK